MENTIVVGIGEALWDVLPEGKKIGGAPANFAYHVSQFGLDGLSFQNRSYESSSE
jgi:fructokinase